MVQMYESANSSKIISIDARSAPSNDLELVAALGRGDTHALSKIYGLYASAVYGVLRRVSRTGSLADDVLQEVFLGLWRNPDRFDPSRGTLKTYLIVVAHRKAIDLIRSETARQRREEVSARSPVQATNGEGEDDRIDLGDAIESLEEQERAAIELAYFGGYSYREVAVILCQPEGTVKSRIRSGLGHIRDHLGADIGGSPCFE